MDSTHAVVRSGWLQPVLRVTGAGLLAATAAIHLDLYLTGYRNIPTIGWLFLLQIIAGFLLAAAVLATGNPVVAALGAGYAVATLAGYLLSVWFGLFGFTEVRTTAGIVAGLLEIAAFAVLGLFAVSPEAASGSRGPGQGLARLLAGIPMAKALVAVVSVVALVLLLVAEAGAGAPAATASGATAALKTGKAGGVTVLTNAKGLTVYTFAADSPGQVELLRKLRRVLAAGDRLAVRRPGHPRHLRHDHQDRRHQAGHLERAPAVHLRGGPRPRLGQREQPQHQWRALEGNPGLRLSHPAQLRPRTRSFVPALDRGPARSRF